MKTYLVTLTVALIAGHAFADIQDPPMNDYKPNRKLGRGLANILFSASETVQAMEAVNSTDGNAAAWSTGIVKGINRMLVRIGVGVFEVVTYPFPIYKQSYRPVLKSNIPWINNGYEEYPPEWSWNSRKSYSTATHSFAP